MKNKSDKKSSSYFGVYWNSKNKKFYAMSFINKTKIYLGSFDNELDAAIIRDKFVRDNNLDRRLNFPDPEPENSIPNTKLIRLTQGKFAIVDKEDFERVNQYNWCAVKRKTTYYSLRTVIVNNMETTEPMHQFIMGNPNTDIDHRNGNGLHNYKSNLRECTDIENQRNKRPLENKTSIYKGVCWDEHWGKFRSYIRHNKKLVHLGSSESDVECALMYDNKAKELFKDFAWLNFPLNN